MKLPPFDPDFPYLIRANDCTDEQWEAACAAAMVSPKVSENTGLKETDGDSGTPFADSEITLASLLLAVWISAGGRDDRLQGLRDAEGSRCGSLPGVLRETLLPGTEGGAAGDSAALRVAPDGQPESVEAEGLALSPDERAFVDYFARRGIALRRVTQNVGTDADDADITCHLVHQESPLDAEMKRMYRPLIDVLMSEWDAWEKVIDAMRDGGEIDPVDGGRYITLDHYGKLLS